MCININFIETVFVWYEYARCADGEYKNFQLTVNLSGCLVVGSWHQSLVFSQSFVKYFYSLGKKG
jgi:hypothetical protein